MAAIGRDLVVMQGGERIMGIRSATLTYNGETIDITSGENDGVRHLLPEVSVRSVDISGEGIMKAVNFREMAATGTQRMLSDITITFPVMTEGNTAATITGDFMLSAYEESYPYEDAATFSFTLMSSGEAVYTAEATP